MFLFSDYKKLSRNVKILVTTYAVNCILDKYNLNSVNQIPNAIKKSDEHSFMFFSNNRRFWYKKLNGEPILREYVVDEIDEVIPNFKLIFCLPLWQLIDNQNHTLKSLNLILLSLPKLYKDALYNETTDGIIISKSIVRDSVRCKLSNQLSLSGLTYLLIRSYESMLLKSVNIPRDMCIYNLQSVKLFVLLAEFSPLKIISEQLRMVITNQDKKLQMTIKTSPLQYFEIGTLPSIPIRFSSLSEQHSEWLMNVYKLLLKHAIEKGFVDEIKESHIRFYWSISLSEMKELNDLFCLNRNTVNYFGNYSERIKTRIDKCLGEDDTKLTNLNMLNAT